MTSVSLIGMTSGPPLIGFLADRMAASAGSMRWTFALVGIAGIALVIPALVAVRGRYLVTQAAARAADETEQGA
jgi:MFS family permease